MNDKLYCTDNPKKKLNNYKNNTFFDENIQSHQNDDSTQINKLVRKTYDPEIELQISIDGVGFLKGYSLVRKSIFVKHEGSPKVKKLLQSSKSFIERWYNDKKSYLIKLEYGFRNSKSHQGSQRTLDSYTPEGEKLFMDYNEDIWRNRFILGITHMVYQLKCKIKPFKGMSYFGFTDDLNRRIEEHIMESLAPRGICKENHMHVSLIKLHSAIRKAIKLNIKYSRLLSKGVTFEEIYTDLVEIKGTKEYKIRLYYIREDIIKCCFDIVRVEITRGVGIARDREREYTRSYRNDDGTIGTVENGLNEREGGGGRGISGIVYKLPWLDILGMLSLGVKYISITEIIKKQYRNLEHLKIRELNRQIKNMLGKQQNVYLKFMLPILEKLLKYDRNIMKKDILDLLDWSNNKFDRYFGSIKCLKEIIKKYGYLDVKIVKTHIESKKKENDLLGTSSYKLKTLMRGVDIGQYKEWIIEGKTGIIIGKKIGTSREMVYYIYQQISHLLVGTRGLSFDSIQKKLRRDVAIKSLGCGMNPRNIIGEKFKLKSYKKMTWDEVHEFYERLFEKNGVRTLSYRQIMDKYSQNF